MENSNPKVLKLLIDISEDVQATILVHQNDDPAELAESFLSEHSLDPSLKANLVKLIKSQQKNLKIPSSGTDQKSSAKSLNSKSSSLSALTERILKHSYRYSESSRIASKKFNYGQLLYEKGLELKENQRQNSEKRLQEKENLSKSHSFRPVISKNSEEIAKSAERQTRIKRNQELFEKLKMNKEEKEMKECYFTPMISQRSNKHSRKNIFNELYEDAREKRKRSEDFGNRTEKSSFFKGSKKVDVGDLVDRLTNSRKKTEFEIEKLRHDAESAYDKQTGQKLFVPVIGKQSDSKCEKRNVWEELYYYRQQNKKVEYDTEKTLTLTSERTGRIFENFKKHRFEGIFKKLDSDNDGKISCEKISIESFDKDQLLILSSVLLEIESTKKSLDFQEFSLMMESLYNKLGTQEKMVLTRTQNEEPRPNFSFTPTINTRSMNLASSPHLGESIYDRTKAAKEIKEMKMKKMNEMKAAGTFLKVSKG